MGQSMKCSSEAADVAMMIGRESSLRAVRANHGTPEGLEWAKWKISCELKIRIVKYALEDGPNLNTLRIQIVPLPTNIESITLPPCR
jgi:hypothetical protein